MSIPPSFQETRQSPGAGASGHRRSWLIVFSFILALFLLFFTLRGLDWATFWQTIKNGQYGYLLLVIPISSFNYFTRAVRWNVFVRSNKGVGIMSVFWANMVGYLGNAYLPARAGELLRSAFLGQRTGLGTSFILATALVERLLDVIALVLIGSVSLLWLGNTSTILTGAVRIMALVAITGLAVIVAAPFQEKVILGIIVRIPIPKRYIDTLSVQATRFLTGMRSLQDWRRLTLFIFLTCAIWVVDAVGTMVGVRIISQTISIWQALILLAALGLSSVIPSTPGYVGVYQFVAVSVLTPFGFSQAEALAFIVISQILNYLVVSFWGLLGLSQINKYKRTKFDVEGNQNA